MIYWRKRIFLISVRHSVLNDRFRFRRELFGGNEEKMNKAISDLNDLSSYEESVTYLNKVLNWNIEDASVADFIKLLEKRFS